ncbi:MAG: hypothetical protein EU521_00520 [Promethearchaeota archaeon]|nr:MAG: hypothetical protein EU521_00520 [Candidatus Lokiarchaeota archaeon]
MKISGEQKVIFNGPFYTGFLIDTSFLMNQGYSLVQERIFQKLQQNNSDGWFVEGGSQNDLLWDTEYTSLYGGTPLIPSSFMGKKNTLEDEIIEFEGFKFQVIKILFFYHDYGVGVYRINVKVDLHQEIEMSEYRKLVERFNPLLSDIINPYIKEDTIALKTTLEENNIAFNSFEHISKKLKEKQSEFIPVRLALWYHRIFEFKEESENIPVPEETFEGYKRLLFSSQLNGPQNCALDPDVIVIPAFGFSLFIYDKNNYPKDIDLNRLVETAQYYYAATSLLDTIMFSKLAEYSIKRTVPPKIKQLEVEIEDIKTLSDELELFLLILKDTIINFSPSSILMWRNLEKEWYYMPMLESLQQKNDLLNTKYSELLDELNQKRSETLNKFVKIFTVFAILGPLIEIYSFARDENLITLILDNLGIVLMFALPIVGVLLGVALYIGKKYFF